MKSVVGFAVYKRRERRRVASARSAGTGVYSNVHEDAEHRTAAKYRAQQLQTEDWRSL